MNKTKEEERRMGLGVDFKEGLTPQDLEEEQSIFEKDQKRLNKKFNSIKHPNFRLTAGYLMRKAYSGEVELDKKNICKDLKLSMPTLNLYLSELNRFLRFQPIRWISISGKKDFIEIAGANFRNSNKWIKKNYKGLVSRTTRVLQTKEKVKIKEEEKELENLRNRQKNKIKNILKEVIN